MKNNRTHIAVLLALLALLAWGGVVFFAGKISADQQQRARNVTNAQQQAQAQNAALRLHALANDTVLERAQLDTILNIDVVSVANMIRAAGHTAGINATLSGALPESSPADATQVNAIGFVVEGTGKFSALMDLVQILESLPVPSSIDRLDIQRVQDANGAPGTNWQLSVYVHVLTTSPVSS